MSNLAKGVWEDVKQGVAMLFVLLTIAALVSAFYIAFATVANVQL